MEKLYFKVYADKESVDIGCNHYIETVENVLLLCNDKERLESDCFDGLYPVFEPVFMTEEQFNNLT
jgi:hypothetical protein